MPRDTDPDDEVPGSTDSGLGEPDVVELMEPMEPYTTGELAGILESPRRVVRSILDRLAAGQKVRKKEPEPNRVIWIREAPKHSCPDCGWEFEVKFLHPVLSSVRFCPRCGTQL